MRLRRTPIRFPGLLVNIIGHEGSGVLSRATTIQRINTRGGKAPASGCDAAHAGQERRVHYSADYLFYAPTGLREVTRVIGGSTAFCYM